MAETRFSVFVNRRAGRGDSADRLERWLLARPELARQLNMVSFSEPDELVQQLQQLPPEVTPVAGGGDGTAALLVSVLREVDAERPVGVLPLGTGNALAHALGLHPLARALEILVAGVPRRFDLMTTTHPDAPVVLCSLSAGAEGEVIAAFTRAGRRWSRAWFTAAGLLGGRRYELALEVDGEPVESPPGLFNAGIYNAPCYGFGLRFWKGHGRFDDGAAEGVTWRTAGDYLRLAVSRGPRRPSGVKLIPGRRFRLESDGPIQVDGESLPPGPQLVELRVEPGAWRAIVAKDVPNRSIPQPSQ